MLPVGKGQGKSRGKAKPSIDPKQTFGPNLRDRRNRAGLTQEELGHLAGLHRTTIGLYERGKALVKLLGVRFYSALNVRQATQPEYENAHGGRIGHWKLKIIGTQTPKLYDLTKDPNEHDDVWGKSSTEIGARMLLDPMWLLRNWNVEWKKSQWGNAAAVTARFAADLGE